MLGIESIIKKPLMTEKSASMTERDNCYTFSVAMRSTKAQVKQAIESVFDVKVVKVNTVTDHGCVRKTKRGLIKSSGTKKAYVTVKAGQKIEFFRSI